MNLNLAKYLNGGFVLFLCLSVFFVPLKIHYSNICIGATAALWALNWKENLKNFNPKYFGPVILFTSLYAIQIIGLIHTDNLSEGMFELEKKLSLLAFPIMIFFSSIDEKDIRRVELALTLALCTASIFCFYHIIQSTREYGLPVYKIFTDPLFQYVRFTTPLGLHPAYFSSCLLLAIVICLIRFRKNNFTFNLLLALVILLFLLTLLILMSRTGIVAMLVLYFLLIIFVLIKRRKTKMVIAGLVVAVSLIVIMQHFIPSIRTRLEEAYVFFERSDKNQVTLTSVGAHYNSWHCAFSSIDSAHLLFGYGTGDEQDVLNECYLANNWKFMIEGGPLDAHNEYLSGMVRHGLIGLFLFLAVIGLPLIFSWQTNSIEYFSFIIIIALAALSESVLRGQVSLVFYAVFNSLYFKRIAMANENRNMLALKWKRN